MKRVGLAAFDSSQSAFNTLSSTILEQQAQELNTQLSVFQSALTYFAVEHASEIRSNPQFRSEFAKMCTAIGVDPLASSSTNKKGGSMWASVLGKDLNDFYFELAVRVIEICRLTKNENGGMISISEVRKRLADSKLQLRPIEVTDDDIQQAVKSLKVLGPGFDLVVMARNTMIRSVPSELSIDQTAIIEASNILGYVSVSMLRDNLGWTHIRCKAALGDMVSAGLLWIDDQGGRELQYWIPSWVDMD